MAKIVAITGCPAGVAHTQMAAEALKKTAAFLGHDIKVEMQGRDPLSPQDIAEADVVLLAPSNPVVSVGSILNVPGIREAMTAKTVVGVSPIIGGAPVRGMADACLRAIGVETSAGAVAAHLGADLLDGWLVDEADAGTEVEGVDVRALPLYMSDPTATEAIARAAVDLALELAGKKEKEERR